MSSEKFLPTTPHVEIPNISPLSISTIPPTPLEDTDKKDHLDSNENPNIDTHFLSYSIRRPPGPRKSNNNPPNHDKSASANTDDSWTTISDSSVQSQDGSDPDEEFDLRPRKKRPHSGVIAIPEGLPYDKLAQNYAILFDERNRLVKLRANLEKKGEDDAVEIGEIQETLKATRIVKNTLEPRTLRAESELADLQEIHHEIVSRNAELEGLNRFLRREATQAQKSEEKLRLLNQSMINQSAEVMKTLFKKDEVIGQLREAMVKLMEGKDAARPEAARAEQAQKLLAGQDKELCGLKQENLALQKEMEAVRTQIGRFEQNQYQLAEDIWLFDGAQIVPRDGSGSSTPGSWNFISGSQTTEDQSLIGRPPSTDTSTMSKASGRTPQPTPTLPSRSPSLRSKIDNAIMGFGGSLGGVYGSRRGSQQESPRSSPLLLGLGIRVRPAIGELNRPADVASTQTPVTYVTAETQTTTSVPLPATKDASNQVEVPLNDETISVQTSPHASRGVQTEPLTVQGKVEKLPYFDADRQPSPREVFEMMRATIASDEQALILPRTTYVDTDLLPKPNDRADTGVPTDTIDGGWPENMPPCTYNDAEVQKYPEHVKMELLANEIADGNVGSSQRSKDGGAVTPLWCYAVLGLFILMMLTHAFFVEKRFWMNANQLTRRAVVSMRDEQWGSELVEKLGYALDQKARH